MVLMVRHNFGFYKRFENDIWGLFFSGLSRSVWLKNFFYNLYLESIDLMNDESNNQSSNMALTDLFEGSKSMNYRFLSLRLVRLFYVSLTYKQLRAISCKAARMDGFFQSNFCFLLEGSLLSMVYRSNFFVSFFEIGELVNQGLVLVNGAIVTFVNYTLRVGDILSIIPNVFDRIFFNLEFRVRNGSFLFNTPRFLFVNYNFCFSFMELQPNDADLAFPVDIDIYRVTGYY